ncbi:16S rRNA (cytosine1407-C5)-methyltransferase [Pseudoalteromonas ulvae UL12]|uniref:16S rRNA (cytosine(1407)-C(5))-methyltransferase RsmF n=1 Tax=Pseudoalteromonas ulvae TaxID=107327 RepID=UPI00186B8092|nr:16S rRNA (cytosine(1407)-C(5))-methyltransferase RsmF [Pseudoalteromonas ulvae]MBE0363200.1 16S rRNA (cytosine1407-C5)-methyltransferase [Pseudoalteromonas ulvae UL12]
MDAHTYIPAEFIADVQSYIPQHLTIADYIESCQRPLRPALRVNTLKTTVAEFQAYADEHSWTLTPIPWCPDGFWFERPLAQQTLSIGNTDIHLSGGIYIQEASSMLPVFALQHQTNLADCCVLDMAAAPGSKTSQLAAAMDNSGFLIANELSSSRLKSLSANMQRLGVANTALSHFDGAIFGSYMEQCFDHILLDAPCSGEGTVRKDPNALKNWSIESNQHIAEVQKQLIESAFYALKTGGTLVYSTCTLTPLENQQVCQHLLEMFADHIDVLPLDTLFEGAEQVVTDEGYLHVWPQVHDTEGFFIAKFKKLGHTPHPNPQAKKGAFPFSDFSSKESQAFMKTLTDQFGISHLAGNLAIRDKELWLFPEQSTDLKEKIKFSRLGILIGQTHRTGVRLCHEFATALGHLATKNHYELSTLEACDYFQGKDIKLPHPTSQQGEVLLTLCGNVIGLGKWQKNKIKNSLPRDLVRDNQLITWE